MARSAPALSSFTAGEISPRLEGRVSIEKYREGLSDLTNMIVQPHGGVQRRPGTEYLGEVKASDNIARLIPFEFKTADTYALEFGNLYMRVFRNGLQVLNAAKTISAITKANPGVLTSSSHGYSNGDEVYLTNTGAMSELKTRNYRVANVTTHTFTLTDLYNVDINTTGFTTFDSGVTTAKIYEVTTPYAHSDLDNLRFAQSADVMYFCHPSYAIRTLSRSDHDNWTIATLSISGSPTPNLNNATNNYPSVVTFFEQRLVFGATNNNPQTLWFSKSADYDNFTVGTNDDDALIYTIASNKVNAIRYLSATRVMTIGTSGGEYVLTTTNGGPVTPTATVIRKYSNYGCTDADPVQVADVTLFIQRGSRKVREFKYAGDVNQDAYTAPDITILAEHLTEGGVLEFAFQQEPESIIWGRRTDGTLLGLTYRREEDVYAWHKHVIGGHFSECTVTVTDYANIAVGTTLTFTKSDGTTVTFTSEASGSSAPTSSTGFRPNTNNNTTADNIFTAVNAHSDFTVSNPASNIVTIKETSPSANELLKVSSSDSTRLATTDQSIAMVESIISLPTDSGEDELYMIVKRTINSQTKRYVEVLKPFDFGSSSTTSFFVDSGLVYSGSAITSVNALYHLEGQNTVILANGATHSSKTVSSGSITFDFSITSGAVGLGYTSTLQTLRLEAGSVDGTSQGKPKRIHAVTVRFDKTVGAEIGTDSNNVDRIFFRDDSMEMDTAIPLFTGDREIEFPGGFDDDAKIFIRQAQPLPLTVLAIFPRLNTFDI
tara:strand:- start:80 stop:2401 length:2322 start_codon:yes stop_codon:yes gene_type:complete